MSAGEEEVSGVRMKGKVPGCAATASVVLVFSEMEDDHMHEVDLAASPGGEETCIWRVYDVLKSSNEKRKSV